MDWQQILAVVGPLTALGLSGLVYLARGIARLEAEMRAMEHELHQQDDRIRENDQALKRHTREPQHGPTPYVTEPVCRHLHDATSNRFNGIEQRLDRIEKKIDRLVEQVPILAPFERGGSPK